MIDLSLASIEDIAQELQRRYPAGLLALLTPVDGSPGGLSPKVCRWHLPPANIAYLVYLVDFARDSLWAQDIRPDYSPPVRLRPPPHEPLSGNSP